MPTQTDRTGATFSRKSGLARASRLLSRESVTLPASPVRYLPETAAIADRDLTMPKTGRVALGRLLATTSLGCALAAACGPSAPPAASPTAAAPSASATAAPSPTAGE